MRARGCSGCGSGSQGQCIGDSTETEDCKISDCPGNLPKFKASAILTLFRKELTAHGSHGGHGPSAQCPVARGPNSGPEHAVKRLSEATMSAPETQQRLKIVVQLNVQVVSS